MSDPLDDATLSAYVDGELDAARLREVERALEHNAEARERVHLMREVTYMLQLAYRLNPMPKT